MELIGVASDRFHCRPRCFEQAECVRVVRALQAYRFGWVGSGGHGGRWEGCLPVRELSSTNGSSGSEQELHIPPLIAGATCAIVSVRREAIAWFRAKRRS